MVSRPSAGSSEIFRDIHASIFVVLHISRGRSVLPEILTRAGRLPAAHPTDGEPLQYGRIYVGPPDHHLAYGPRVIGIVLTGEKASADWDVKLRPRERAPLSVSMRVRGDGMNLRWVVRRSQPFHTAS